jgi:uncharacterized repeat protein (TIGR02543 family)
MGNYNLEVTFADIEEGDMIEVVTTAIFAVNFQPNNGATIDGISVVGGNKVIAPTEPVKAHYTFAGWYSDEALTNAWNFEVDTVSEALTLYAKWTPVAYTITYDFAGGTVEHTNPTTYTVEDEDITLVAPTSATKTGYTFAGWDITTIDTEGAVNVTVTATWTANAFTATFNSDGGSTVADHLVELDAAIGNLKETGVRGENIAAQLQTLGNDLQNLENEVRGGFAASAALSALVPNARATNDTQISLGTGMYRDRAGFAIGAFHYVNDNVLLNAGAAYGGSKSTTVKAGITFGW